MNSNLKMGILIMLLCTLFTTIGQLFFKYGSASFEWNLTGILLNYHLILGFFFYAIGAILLMAALRFGSLSVIYPFVSLTFIWVLLISVWFFGEKINHFKTGAVVFIIFGVIMVARGSKDGE